MTIESLDLADIQQAARHAWRIMIAYPWRLIGCVLVMLFLIEPLSALPRIAYLARGALGVVLFAQALLLFRSAERGEKPHVFTLFEALALPLSSQFVLVLSEWGTFAIAIAFVAKAGGVEAVHKFFGEPYAELTLDPSLYNQFRVVQFVVNAATTFLGPAIVLAGIHGLGAIRVALQAAARNVLFVALLLCIDLGLEFGLNPLDQVTHLVVLVPMLVYELALLYAASIRVFGLTEPPRTGADGARS